jgi:hypothetical protein
LFRTCKQLPGSDGSIESKRPARLNPTGLFGELLFAPLAHKPEFGRLGFDRVQRSPQSLGDFTMKRTLAVLQL